MYTSAQFTSHMNGYVPQVPHSELTDPFVASKRMPKVLPEANPPNHLLYHVIGLELRCQGKMAHWLMVTRLLPIVLLKVAM